MSSGARSGVKGFTLVELMVVMAIFAIVAAIAAPSFRDFTIRRAISAQISDFASAVRFARSEAVKRGREVSMCPALYINNIAPMCNRNTREWQNGYIVFTGSLFNKGQYQRAQQGYAAGSRIEANVRDAFRFRGNGVLSAGGPRKFIFSPALPPSDPSYKALTRTMCLSSTGVLYSC
ncbi:MAG: GspH/FimT family pseudopilin [Lautropia sp.]|nr:GspH/FimT family pseudopilin [Lautropia sp.]